MSLYTKLTIDDHIFNIPNDPVKSFRFIREQIITSYRAVTAGKSTPRDLAFIFGTATEVATTEIPTMEIATAEAITTEGATTKVTTTQTTTEVPTMEVGTTKINTTKVTSMEVATIENTATGVATMEATGGGGAHNEEVGISSQGRKRKRAIFVENDDEDGGGDGGGGDKEGEDDENDEDEEEEAHKTKSSHDGKNRNGLSGISFVWPKPEEVEARMRELRASENSGIFVGDFSNFDDALRKTGMNYQWRQRAYIEGRLTIEGRSAKVEVKCGRDRCDACLVYSLRRETECKVLVTHTCAPAVLSFRCSVSSTSMYNARKCVFTRFPRYVHFVWPVGGGSPQYFQALVGFQFQTAFSQPFNKTFQVDLSAHC
ncbi:uncharacterized protein H6S33_010872 [Morchella sextelata]|uniref:uncharacterized protein n=1 Tax=Morchella sextelata TaxID=1174677 RepID=UPI001D0514A5|nr:uncharacterized protein H6S33_010872 [Morchella sextelata]KAH0611607.1 hypothetical protein H6S33_010872 [Morchella sextelata]